MILWTIQLSILRIKTKNTNFNRILGHELHLRQAEKAREAMLFDTEKSAANDSYYAFSFDLEKSLSFPKLTCQVAYYKRNWYVYIGLSWAKIKTRIYILLGWSDWIPMFARNRCLFDLTHKNQGSWGVGAKHVVFSDTFTVQNRNWKVAMSMMKLVLSDANTIQIIDQNFMRCGHSYLDNDCDFASIENFKVVKKKTCWVLLISRTQQVFPSNDW